MVIKMRTQSRDNQVKYFDQQLVYIYSKLRELQWSLVTKQRFYQQVMKYCKMINYNSDYKGNQYFYS